MAHAIMEEPWIGVPQETNLHGELLDPNDQFCDLILFP